MVTARSAFGALRTRSHRAGSQGVLWLAALLLGLLYTHGLSAETAVGHASAVTASTAVHTLFGDDGHSGAGQRAAGDAAADAHGDGHKSGHSSQECVSGQPDRGVDVLVPCLAPLDATASPQASAAMVAASVGTASKPPSLRGRSTVLRI